MKIMRLTLSPAKILIFVGLFFVFGSTVHAQDVGLESLRQTGKTFASVAKSVSPSVVFVQAEGSVTNEKTRFFRFPFEQDIPLHDDFFKRFFGDRFYNFPDGGQEFDNPSQGQRRKLAEGSGFIYGAVDGLFSKKAHIITNNHVIQGAEKIRVTFLDGRELEAKVTGSDPQSDIAVLEVKLDDFKALPLGDSSKLEVGEWVIAIGNPFGLSHTLTVGVVSATGRTGLGINDYEDFIQTDAAINPGNSGGPLVNLDGEVIGINTAIFSRSGGYMGIGFAIPINMTKEIAQQLIDTGEVIRGFLGIVIQPLTADLAESFGLKDTEQGILISEVSKDSPAEKAGLKQGDVIIKYRGMSVNEIGDFRNKVSLTAPGTQVMLDIIRDGKKKEIKATIGKLPRENLQTGNEIEDTETLGMTVQTLTKELARKFNIKEEKGLVVTRVAPGSIADMAGIATGTVILKVNQKTIDSASEFSRIVKQTDGKDGLLLLARKGNTQLYIVLKW